MSIARVVTFGILFSCFLFLASGVVFFLIEFIPKVILADDVLYADVPQERLNCTSLTIMDWEKFYNEAISGLTYDYFYVTHLRIEVVNIGKISYPIKGLKAFDLFLVYSKNIGTDDKPLLENAFLRLPYRHDCSIETAPCWRIINISSITEPSDLKIAEMVNPSNFALNQGAWDPNEVADISIYVSDNSRLTLLQVLNDSTVIGGDGWIFTALVTPNGHIARPINLFKITWSLGGK